MRSAFRAFAMCQSMFCALPFPGNIWDEKARDKILLFLPVVGLEIGLIWTGISRLCGILELPGSVTALVIAACPYLLTGAMHLDGYMDVTDAMGSWRDLDRRREILKDSHVGSFSVIGVVLLVLAQFAFALSIPEGAELWILIFVPAVSRCGSALAVTVLPPMSTSQYAGQKKPKYHAVLIIAMALAFVAAGFFFCGRYGFVLLGCAAGYGYALHRAYRSLAGMNGDVAGYALTVAELCAMGVLALLRVGG